jgi:hypothetical protein
VPSAKAEEKINDGRLVLIGLVAEQRVIFSFLSLSARRSHATYA